VKNDDNEPALSSSSDLALWLLSVALGVLGVLILFTLGVPGVVLLFAVVIVWTRSAPRRALRAGGALAGFGAAFLALIAAANARCAEFSAQDRQDCTAPDVTAFTVAAALMVVVGLTLTIREWTMRSA
jgi:hypothetical protein